MYTDGDIPRDKLGSYLVSGKQYTNKYHALENCSSGEWPHFNFHDNIYSQVNWLQEPQEDLYEIYRQRAQQLRDKYDYLIIYYSGGIDSHCVLRTFLDNDIKLDGIIVSGSYSIESKIKTTCNMEQRTVALPFLQELKNRGINIPVHFLDTVNHHHYEDENWIYACGHSLTPQIYSYNFFWQDPWVKNFLERGSTGFIRGVDKPRVILEDDVWYVSFINVHILSGTPSGYLSKKQNWDIQEYFFWTPDMTKIVNKQAHVLIKWIEENLSYEQAKTLTTKNNTFNRKTYNNYVDPLVYGKYLDQKPGQVKTYFSLNKPIFTNLWHKDLWFLQVKDENSKNYQSWLAGLRQVSEKIDPIYLNGCGELSDEVIKKHYMDKDLVDLKHVLNGTVGSWSKFHKIRKFRWTE